MCWTCDNPQATEADYEARMWDKIDRFGWAIQYIEPSKTSPPWAYTVGLTLHRKPELVVMGLRANPAGNLLNGIAAHVMHAEPPEPGTQMQLTDGPYVEYVELTDPTAHLFTAVQMFGSKISALQVVYPDDRGHWPWHRGFRGGRGGQPVLGRRAIGTKARP